MARRYFVDEVFRALGSPVRVAILQRLTAGDASTSTLSEGFDMALPSFMEHLALLEEAGLVRSEKQGRTRIYRLVPRELERAEDWMAKLRAGWECRLSQMEEHLHVMARSEPKKEHMK